MKVADIQKVCRDYWYNILYVVIVLVHIVMRRRVSHRDSDAMNIFAAWIAEALPNHPTNWILFGVVIASMVIWAIIGYKCRYDSTPVLAALSFALAVFVGYTVLFYALFVADPVDEEDIPTSRTQAPAYVSDYDGTRTFLDLRQP